MNIMTTMAVAFHGRDHVEHHHHHPHDHGVVAVHEQVARFAGAGGGDAVGWSGSMFAALTASNVSPQLPELSKA
jgi:hypothetical protein